jgi:hypothetical protein
MQAHRLAGHDARQDEQLQALPAHRAEFLRGMARKNCGLEVVNSFT